MKKSILQVIIFFILNSYLNAQANIRFAPLPMENYQITLNQYKDFISFLKKQIKTDVNIVYEASYSEIINNFINGKVDIMVVGPATYIDLTSKYKFAKPIAQTIDKDGLDTYTCSIFCLNDKNINLSNLKDTNIALTQAKSTCGYPFTNYILNKNSSSISNNNYKYTGSHSDAILSVLLGESELGSAYTRVVKEYLDLGIKPIQTSKKLPNFILMANTKTLSKESIQQIYNALKKLNPKNKKNLLSITKDWNHSFKHGLILVDDKKQKQIEETIKDSGIKLD